MSNNRLANVNTRALGLNGTRFAVVTFATSATVHLQIDDRHTRTVNAMKAKIDEIQVNKMLFIYIKMLYSCLKIKTIWSFLNAYTTTRRQTVVSFVMFYKDETMNS